MCELESSNLSLKSNLYPVYGLEKSDSGYFFKKTESDKLYYIYQGNEHVYFKNDGWLAKSILILGNGELYVVSWEHDKGPTATWFLDNKLKLFFNKKNLLSDDNYKDTNYAQLWSSYLKDVLNRIWYSLITPNLLQTHPDFSPSELFISEDVMNDFNSVFNSFNHPCQFINISKDQSDLLSHVQPPIQKKYLVDNLITSSSYADNWQDKAIANGYVEIKCPFTGELIQSKDSLLLPFNGLRIAYRFQSQNTIFFLIATLLDRNEIAYFFPKENLVLFQNPQTDRLIQQNEITTFVRAIVRDWKFIKPYLLEKKARKVAISNIVGHIGHHLWNELSAFERMENNKVLKNVTDCYVNQSTQVELYGPIERLFPLLSGKVHRIDLANLPKLVYEKNHFYVKPCDTFISQNLANRIINYSYKEPTVLSSSYEYLQKVTKEQFAIIILFTLRLDNRSWIDQEQGICKILSKLSETYKGNIALILDGHNKNESGIKLRSYMEHLVNSSKGIDLFDQEYQMAERIKESISSTKITVINTIGCTVPESIRWCLQSDFFVAPWGAGLAKYKWVTNTPGVIFSSREMLAAGELHLYDDCKFRENAFSSEYLDSKEVHDIDEISIVGGSLRKNFNLSSIETLYEKVKIMCEKYGRLNKSIGTPSKI